MLTSPLIFIWSSKHAREGAAISAARKLTYSISSQWLMGTCCVEGSYLRRLQKQRCSFTPLAIPPILMEPSLLLCPGETMVNKKDEITAPKRPQLSLSISHSSRFSSGFCSFLVIRELFLLLIKIPLTLNLSHAYFPSRVALISPLKSLLPTSPCISLTFSLFKPESSFFR